LSYLIINGLGNGKLHVLTKADKVLIILERLIILTNDSQVLRSNYVANQNPLRILGEVIAVDLQERMD